MDLPKTWPALDSMLFDDQNRLWVSTIVKDQNMYQWWVLSEKGKPLARFIWPRTTPIKVVKNGYLYTVEAEKQSGIKHMVRYKLQIH